MNLFYLDEDMDRLAQAHVQKHVTKMMIEATQMLSTSVRFHLGILTKFNTPHGEKEYLLLPGETIGIDDGKWFIENKQAYKITHQNHPCALWIRESTSNFQWAVEYVQALGREARFRSGREDKYEAELIAESLPCPKVAEVYPTPFKVAISPEYCKTDDVVQSYRRYYRACKDNLANWGSRGQPDWWEMFSTPGYCAAYIEREPIKGRHYAMRLALNKIYGCDAICGEFQFHQDMGVVKYVEDDVGFVAQWQVMGGLIGFFNTINKEEKNYFFRSQKELLEFIAS